MIKPSSQLTIQLTQNNYSYLCIIIAATLPRKALYLIKWTDENGCKQSFRLVDKVCNKWREFGILLGFSKEQLDEWETGNSTMHMTCWFSSINPWLQHGTSAYPNTWEGLYELLRDVKCHQIAEELKKAVTAAF